MITGDTKDTGFINTGQGTPLLLQRVEGLAALRQLKNRKSSQCTWTLAATQKTYVLVVVGDSFVRPTTIHLFCAFKLHTGSVFGAFKATQLKVAVAGNTLRPSLRSNNSCLVRHSSNLTNMYTKKVQAGQDALSRPHEHRSCFSTLRSILS